jgi:hypothetical protein
MVDNRGYGLPPRREALKPDFHEQTSYRLKRKLSKPSENIQTQAYVDRTYRELVPKTKLVIETNVHLSFPQPRQNSHLPRYRLSTD